LRRGQVKHPRTPVPVSKLRVCVRLQQSHTGIDVEIIRFPLSLGSGTVPNHLARLLFLPMPENTAPPGGFGIHPS
jgi:hypothetical protein